MLDQILKKKSDSLTQLPDLDFSKLNCANAQFHKTIQANQPAIIAEMKHASPSQGRFLSYYDPADIARTYQIGGACCLSVLTDTPFFDGQFDHIRQAKTSSNLPVLCKDFIIDAKQIKYARFYGADACLLIARILTETALDQLTRFCHSLGMDALIEVFDEDDLVKLKNQPSTLIGINNRDLATLKIDTSNAYRLKAKLHADYDVLNLSGAQTPYKARQMADDFDGLLIGSALMKADDPALFLDQLLN
jgi:indole-3-glycerol phosphate synthase